MSGAATDTDITPNRAQRRAVLKAMRRVVPTAAYLRDVIAAPGRSRAERDAARVWLRFPETPQHNILARANALSKRRRAAKRAKASRKANRGVK